MKIKGLVWGAALWAPLTLNGGLRAEEIDLTGMMDEVAAAQGCDTCCDTGCDTGCCDECGCGDGCGCFAPFWFAGTEFLFLGIDASSEGRGNIYFQAPVGARELLGATGYEDFTYAPRLSLGRQLSENWGIVGRFFYLSDHEGTTDGQLNLAAAPSSSLISDSRARLYTVDVEAVRSIQGEVWKVDATAGIRHAELDINSDLQGVGFPAINSLQVGSSSTGSSFDGTGLTTALIGRRQLGNSAAHLFASARGSLLWGDSDTSAEALAIANEDPDTDVDADADFQSEDTEMFVSELSIGVQWDFALRRIPANAFFRTAFEYQNWDVDGDVGASANAVAGGGPINNQTTVGASAGPAEVDLYGLVIGAGFTW